MHLHSTVLILKLPIFFAYHIVYLHLHSTVLILKQVSFQVPCSKSLHYIICRPLYLLYQNIRKKASLLEKSL